MRRFTPEQRTLNSIFKFFKFSFQDDQSCNISTNEECAMGTNVLENDAILMNIDDTVENVLENDVSLMNFNDTEVKVSENVTSINFNDNEENFTGGSKVKQLYYNHY